MLTPFQLTVNGETSGVLMHLQFPITIGTVPFRIPNLPPPQMQYGKTTTLLYRYLILNIVLNYKGKH